MKPSMSFQFEKKQSSHAKHEVIQPPGRSVFNDRRPEIIAQRNLRDIINNSASAIQLRALGKMINSSQRMAAQHQQNASLIGKFIQRKKILTLGGEWEDVVHKKIQNEEVTGLDMKLEFTPNARVNASKIGLTQAIHSQVNGELKLIGRPDQKALQHHRMVTEGESKGWMIDRLGNPNITVENEAIEPNNPVYGSDRVKDPIGKTIRDTTFSDQESGFSQLGRRIPSDSNVVNAVLADTPKLTTSEIGPNSHQIFETTALALEGDQEGTYYGSVTWGWEKDQSGKYREIQLEMKKFGRPSPNFLKSAEKWNASVNKANQVPEVSIKFGGQKGDVVIEGKHYNLATHDDSARNIPLPIPEEILPDVDKFKLMKNEATNRKIPFSHKLKTKSYDKYVEKCALLRKEDKFDELISELEKLHAELKKMDDANIGTLGYWKNLELKNKYFAPIYNSVDMLLQVTKAKIKK